MKLLRAILLPTALIVAGCQSTSPGIDSGIAGRTGPEVIQAEGPYADAASGFTFPVSIGDFVRTDLSRDNVNPGGTVAGYKAPPAKGGPLAVIFIYPVTWLERSPGTAASCDTEFQANKEAITRTRRSARLVSERRGAFGPDAVMEMAEFEYSHMFDGEVRPLSSRVYLFCMADTGWILKLRFSAPMGVEWSRTLAPFEKELTGPWSMKRPVRLSLDALPGT
ncbi:hypothetical protein [Inquilinus limosus]|uniref:hypothetical protein n=1 Tax=Inquilinus limosus TaxID=171674 RepID=UPI0012699C87|nr:hypothetical protein [Inquilinus limosus]